MQGRTVLVAGATSASGAAAVHALVDAGAISVAVGRDAEKLSPLQEAGARVEVCDLTDETQVQDLAAGLAAEGVHVDGILHLVGGWRGGGGLPGQTDEDYRALEGGLTALRHVTRVFWEDLLASPAARVAIVSSTAVARPRAGGANYVTVKAAEEAWARAVAQGFTTKAPNTAASVVFRVTSLAGLEDALATEFVALWDATAADVNDTIVALSE